MRRSSILVVALLSLACGKRDAAPQKEALSVRTSTHQGVELLEVFEGGADETSPIVVGIHGMGDTPAGFATLWKGFPGRARFVFPRAPLPRGEGFSWFDFVDGMSDADFGKVIAGVADRLWPAIAELAGSRHVTVTGFSQGGILSYALAVRHATELTCALPISGTLPGVLNPAPGARIAPTFGLHGSEDHVLDIKWARQTAAAFKGEGREFDFREYPGVGHTVTDAMRADLYARLATCLAK